MELGNNIMMWLLSSEKYVIIMMYETNGKFDVLYESRVVCDLYLT